MERIPPRVLEVAQQQARELLALDRESQAAVTRRLESVFSELVDRIQGAPASSFASGETRLVAVLADVARARSVEEVEALLGQSIEGAWGMALPHANEEIQQWLDHHGGAPRQINLEAVAQVERETLIERYQGSLDTYGQRVADQIRARLSSAIIARRDRAGLVGEVRQAIDAERWRAHRIVRTEISNAYNAAHNAALFHARDSGQVPGLKKTAIVTFDARTAQDSLPMEGQVRELEEMFVDGEGRRFLHPPGRPNDREKEIAWLDDAEPPEEPPPPPEEPEEEEPAPLTPEEQAEDERNRSIQRTARFTRGWKRSSQRPESIAWQRGAKLEFQQDGVVYTPRAVDISGDRIATARGDIRRVYGETQAAYAAEGVERVTLRRPLDLMESVSGEVHDGHLASWTSREMGEDEEWIEEEVDVRRILVRPDTAGWRDQGDGEHVILPGIPKRRFERGGFDVGFFDASEYDEDAERAGPFGIAIDPEDDSAILHHIPSGRTLLSGRYTREELRHMSHQLELAGHVRPDGSLTAGDRFDGRAFLSDLTAQRRAARAEGRDPLTWSEESFDLGFLTSEDFDPSAERAGVWGIVEYGPTEDAPGGGALYHVPTSRAVVDGPFRRADLRRLAQELDPFVDDEGQLPDQRAAGWGDLEEELESARIYYARNRVQGVPGQEASGGYVDVGGVDFPALNPGEFRRGQDLKQGKRATLKVLTELGDGDFQAVEQAGYVNGNFFIYKTKGTMESGTNWGVSDWHIVHAKSGIELHSGPSFNPSDVGEGSGGGLELGGWKLGKFVEYAQENLEQYLDDQGNVRPGAEDDWLDEVEALQRQTAPGFDVRDFLGPRKYDPDDWLINPISRRVRSRFSTEEVVFSTGERVDFLENGPSMEEEIGLDEDFDVPF